MEAELGPFSMSVEPRYIVDMESCLSGWHGKPVVTLLHEQVAFTKTVD
jgi:hypothetical protein